MIDPVLLKIANNPDKVPQIGIMWFAIPSGLVVGHPITYEEAKRISSEDAGESPGDYENQLQIDHPRPEYSEEEKLKGRPPFMLLLNAQFISGECAYYLDNVTIYLEHISAWGFGFGPSANPSPTHH